MDTDPHDRNRQAIAALSAEMYDFTDAGVRRALDALFTPDATVHVCAPFGTMTGPQALYDAVFAPLFTAVPDLERRDYIRVAGVTEHGGHWVGTGGYYTGVKVAPWLDIPPIGHQVFVRAHEFFRFEGGRVTEAQILWDIPAVMMQAGAWPMVPSLGLEFQIPGPATQDGLLTGPRDPELSDASCKLIVDMLSYMKRHPSQGGPEVMEMERFWHPRMNWYGPGGIGTGRGIAGFRNWHQIPWLSGMPDRGQYLDEITYHFFGDANYAAVTGWPNMVQTLTHSGFLGLPPTGQKFTSRSLDFWRIEDGRIRENWVMVDMIDIYAQLGVDVFARLREFNKARNLGPVPWEF